MQKLRAADDIAICRQITFQHSPRAKGMVERFFEPLAHRSIAGITGPGLLSEWLLTTVVHRSSLWLTHLVFQKLYNSPKSCGRSSTSGPSLTFSTIWRTECTTYLRHCTFHCLTPSWTWLCEEVNCFVDNHFTVAWGLKSGLSEDPQDYCDLEGANFAGPAAKEGQEGGRWAGSLNAVCGSALPFCCYEKRLPGFAVALSERMELRILSHHGKVYCPSRLVCSTILKNIVVI